MDEHVRDLDEGELLESLDWNRQVVVRKLDGLTFEQATQLRTPTAVTLLSVVKHLAWVERRWFQQYLLGEPDEGVDATSSFLLEGVGSVEEVRAEYEQSCERSRVIVAQAPSLDVCVLEPHWAFGVVTLRWILLHMIRETARHAGHMDILRELTDGQAGDF